MKRDMELVRELLFAIERCEHGHAPQQLNIEDYSDEQIGYHALLMSEAGLIHAVDSTCLGDETPSAIPIRMTWAGHGFLDACRDEGQWQRAMSVIGEQVKSAPFDVIKAVLAKLIELQVYKVIT